MSKPKKKNDFFLYNRKSLLCHAGSGAVRSGEHRVLSQRVDKKQQRQEKTPQRHKRNSK